MEKVDPADEFTVAKLVWEAGRDRWRCSTEKECRGGIDVLTFWYTYANFLGWEKAAVASVLWTALLTWAAKPPRSFLTVGPHLGLVSFLSTTRTMPETSYVISRANQYGQPSFLEKITIFPKLLTLPVVLAWAYVFNWSGRSRKRNLRDALTRFILTKFNIRQYQYLIGTTQDTYNGWCKQIKREPVIEDIGEGASICWLGDRKAENVIIFFHGGGYLFPAVGPHLKFWDHVRTKLVDRGVNVSVAAVAYTLVPVASFPLQLKQAIAAINHVQSLGVKPQNIQLVGDSAGGNLILQVLAHRLHPLAYKGVPSLSLSAPLKGAYLMSPWVDLADLRGTLKRGDPSDMMPSKTLRYWGAQSLKQVPKEYLPYIQANSASDDWWKGVDAHIDRVLITAGREECLRDEILRFSSAFEKFHPQVDMHEHDGIHDDPLFAVELGESAGGATDKIIDWLQVGF